MRKHQTLLIAGILLLGSAGVAQAQAVYSSPRQPGSRPRRRCQGEGWRHSAVLGIEGRSQRGGVVTVRYSAPLAEGTTATIKHIGDAKRRYPSSD